MKQNLMEKEINFKKGVMENIKKRFYPSELLFKLPLMLNMVQYYDREFKMEESIYVLESIFSLYLHNMGASRINISEHFNYIDPEIKDNEIFMDTLSKSIVSYIDELPSRRINSLMRFKYKLCVFIQKDLIDNFIKESILNSNNKRVIKVYKRYVMENNI